MKYGIIFWGNSIDCKKSLAVTRDSCENNEGPNPEFHANPYSKRWKY
jgi:hypothetical protein